MLLATCCGACGRPGPSPCPLCASALRPCPWVPTPPGYVAGVALLDFDGPARDLVARIKYRNLRGTLRWLADGMAACVGDRSFDVVTWAPTTQRRRRDRGFDHAELLARRVAARLDTPCRNLLVHQPGPPQTGRDAGQRAVGAHFVPTRRLAGERLLVVDDVLTTGATLAAAGRALRRAGAGPLTAVLAAHPR